MKPQTLAAALLVLAPAALLAQRTPSLSEIVLTRASDNVSFALFKNAPNAKVQGTLADGTPFSYDVFITPTFAKQLRAGASGTGKTLAAEVVASHIKDAKLTCRKAGGTQWAGMAEAANNKEAIKSLAIILPKTDPARTKQSQLAALKADGSKFETYLKFELENTLISSYSLSSGGDTPTASLSLNFTKITFTTTTMDHK